ncbi:MAG TPA: biotin-dependent carboxyltransferase family protein [Candidatus Dormibacteraeota bacterium]|nr:biotin-dependent carboxyltransferase family protein [Candidatus Dormibacteraeota bacterium]
MAAAMSSLVVENPGLLTTVQDLGRPGYGPLGVSPSGAADSVALRLGNMLVGNAQGAAALEMMLVGGRYTFPEGGVISMAGADFGANLNGQAIEMWIPHAVHPGGTLELGLTRTGARCYLCIASGIQVQHFLGSASTHLLSGLGGFAGRGLRKGDVLQFGAVEQRIRRRRISAKVLETLEARKCLRVTPGPQADWFSEAAKLAFYEGAFRVSEDADRLGLRLEAASLAPESPREMISEGVSLGAVQVTPSGQLIILFVEQQTAGGYPKIANVIGADLHCIGQLRPRDEVTFARVSLEEARALWMAQERLLNSGEELFA